MGPTEEHFRWEEVQPESGVSVAFKPAGLPAVLVLPWELKGLENNWKSSSPLPHLHQCKADLWYRQRLALLRVTDLVICHLNISKNVQGFESANLACAKQLSHLKTWHMQSSTDSAGKATRLKLCSFVSRTTYVIWYAGVSSPEISWTLSAFTAF